MATVDGVEICTRCTHPMEQVDQYAWMCVPCKVNLYWFQTPHHPDPDQT